MSEIAKSAVKRKDVHGLGVARFWTIVLGMGLAGQLCWNIENQWFNTFVYAKITGNVSVVTAMVIVSAIVTTFSTFIFGTWSDRLGKRKIFVSVGYILWGIATIIFGMTEYARSSGIGFLITLSGFLVVLTDAVMSFFGSMGYDSGFNVWLNDHTDEHNQGQVGSALAALPVIATVVGTIVGGALINIGNPTVGTANYDPSLDNYQILFWTMGIFVIAIGALSLFLMKDAPETKPHRQGSFWRQVTSVFNFKKLAGNKNNKEMMLANLVVLVFFIPFNFYFVHMGNWLIYDIGFTAGNMGLVQGISLLLAVLVTFPFIRIINRDKIPLVVLISILCDALGLILIFLLVKSPADVDGVNLFSLKNIPAFLCVFLIGVGYVLIMQTCMVWVRGLFPEENRGQFEGVRVIFFVLLPMLLGTLIGNVIIKNTPQPVIHYDLYGNPIDVPQENIFLFAGFIVLLTLIPLFFAAKEYRKRINAKREAATTEQ